MARQRSSSTLVACLPLLTFLCAACGLNEDGVLLDGAVPVADTGGPDVRLDGVAHDANADRSVTDGTLPPRADTGADAGTEAGVDGGDGGAACTTASDCPTHGACVTVACTAGGCVYANVADGTPTPMVVQVTGDCSTQECESGVDTAVPDPSDLPAAVNDCGEPSCAGGTPSQSYSGHPAGSSCSTYLGSQAGYCDGAGSCDQCSTDAECPGTSTDCSKPHCASGVCTTAFTAAGTATTSSPQQVAGDCQTLTCDGAGGTKSVENDTDIPVTGTVCITGSCSAGAPSKTIHAGQTCGGTAQSPEVCDAQGACGCQNNADCTLPQTCGGGGTPLVCGCTARSCATEAPPATCGAVPDGCGGSLNCNDGAKDGSETDVDCGGGSTATSQCSAGCAQGKKCGATSDCAGGLTCADGVCCNTACAGACMACSAARKGQGADGVCGPVKAGAPDPKGTCSSQLVATCGDDGATCNGAGACTTWPAGSQCAAPTCINASTVGVASTCVAGTCTAPAPATISCAPYACVGGTCNTACNVDADCASAASDYCLGHVCTPRIAQGGACLAGGAATQCLSGSCVDSVCCNTSCNGQCLACSASLTGKADGVCATVVGGTVDPSATCVAADSSTCGHNGKCETGGACQYYPALTPCGSPAACAGGTESFAGACTGAGSCTTSPSVSCAPYVCGPGTTCLTACGAQVTGDVNCVSGDYCDGNGPGQCQTRLAAAAPCTFNDQCASGTCLVSALCL